jgi:hypothetical protein
MRRFLLTTAALICGLAAHAYAPVMAQDLSNPFGEPETSRPPAKKPALSGGTRPPALAPMGEDRGTAAAKSGTGDGFTEGSATDGWSSGQQSAPEQPAYLPEDAPAASQAIERIDLDPVSAPDGSGLPYELWGGLSVTDVEALLAKVDLPPRSAALHSVWRRLITSNVAPPSGATGTARFTALRAEVLYRSGLTSEAIEILAKDPATATDPLLSTLQARFDIGQGRSEPACAAPVRLTTLPPDMPAPLKAEAILIGGYCAAVAGDMSAAGLKAGLAREIDPDRTVTADLLEMVAAGAKPNLPKQATLSLLDYRVFELGNVAVPTEALREASPALLAALALDRAGAPEVRLQAAEAAASVNAITPDDLAAIYRTSAAGLETQTTDRRAALFRSIEGEQTPAKKTRAIRSLLDDARRSGLYWPALMMMDKPIEGLQPVPEIGWFAETAIEISLASGRYDQARRWAEMPSGFETSSTRSNSSFAHWLALADLADPVLSSGRSTHLDSVEALAGNGRIDANTLHRIVTVLDALEIQVPVPLWDKASRTAQPSTGYLPETGVLSQLQEASKKKEFGRTVLLAMRALGPNGAEGAQLIALGDTIRAMRRAGLEPDARRLGLEALFASWPRAITN